MKANQVDLAAFAVLGNPKQIQHTEESRFARQFWSDVGKSDRRDRIDFDFSFLHPITSTDTHMSAGPDAHRAADAPLTNTVAETFGENHVASAVRFRSVRFDRTGPVP